MGTHWNHLTEAVLMCTQDLCFEQKLEKNITIFHLKIIILTAVKYCSTGILHGRVCVMKFDEPDQENLTIHHECPLGKHAYAIY